MAKKEEPVEEELPTSGKKKIILMTVGALLLVGISVGATFMLLSGESSPEPVETAEVEPQKPEKGDAIFVELKPFTVNLGADDPVGFLQIQINILTFFDDVSDDLEKNKPVLRNNLSLLFAEQKSADLRSEQGKKTLQKKIHESVQKVVNDYGSGGQVADVFFTNFVMQ